MFVSFRLALGGFRENAVVMNKDGVMNEDGLRFNDKVGYNKVHDLIGDLTLLGLSALGNVIARKSGHSKHVSLMKEIAATPDAWELVELKKNGQHSALEKAVSFTMEAGDRLLPILVSPPEPHIVEPPSPA
ncbi:UDP-3-O-acyl-N-acetylglucosamine deacetylase [Thermodesulfobacteriota bacterium]